jgi:hypothetical protein
VCIEEEKVQDARSTLLYHRQHISGHVTMHLQFLSYRTVSEFLSHQIDIICFPIS